MAEEGDALAMPGRLSRKQAREMQRARILDAVVHELSERGSRGTTVAEVTARAGVSRTTFYELYENLDACIASVLRDVVKRSTALMSKAFEREDRWEDGVLGALAALLAFLDDKPMLARVCLIETLAGDRAALEHRARELAALNPLVDAGRGQRHASVEPPVLAAEASVASVAGILHARLVMGEAPPFISLLGQLTGLVVAPYLDPHDVVREIKRAETMACKIAESRPAVPSSSPVEVHMPRALLHPGAHRARACVVFIAANPGVSNQRVAAGIDVSHHGQVSELLGRLAAVGLLNKKSGGEGRPNAWWVTPYGRQIAENLLTNARQAVTLIDDLDHVLESSTYTDKSCP